MQEFYVSTIKNLINTEKVFSLLKDCYWSKDIPIEYVKRFVEHSFCFGAYKNTSHELIGFARVITDYTTYAYICDLVIDPHYRKRGAGKALVYNILNNTKLKGLKTWSLRTTPEAKNIYERFGFEPAISPETIYEIDDIKIYTRKNFINLFAGNYV